MSDIKRSKKAIDNYTRKYRHPSMKALLLSDIYDLFPENESKVKINIKDQWPDTWPNNFRQGAYLIFDDQFKLLYIGKASMKNTIGSRLSVYFGYRKDKGCKIKHRFWSRKPRYVLTVAVPKSTSFEAPAIEEYLINTLTPVDNMHGLK